MAMQKVLVVGGGGREAVICHKLSANKSLELHCAPGNAGIAKWAKCHDVKATDIDGLMALAVGQEFNFVVVAPDDPLALGLVDRLEEQGIAAFGPKAAAAKLEASKSFAKEIMKSAEIPTAAYAEFSSYDAAAEYVASAALPIVIKADGLALGKGVFICPTVAEALIALQQLLCDGALGEAGRKVLIEEYLVGDELTVLLFTDGINYSLMPNSRDHKRAYDGNKGPNTGGMGVVSPGRILSVEEETIIRRDIIEPTLKAMADRGAAFKGVLYIGLMFTAQGPKVIEYNARFGDPEAEAVLPLLKTDLFSIFSAVEQGKLGELKIEWSDLASCCVVIASGGYPGAYATSYPISGLAEAEADEACLVYHAATKFSADGQKYLNSGGRVLDVVATAATAEAAKAKAYAAVEKISFQDMFYRKDIGVLYAQSLDEEN